MLLTSLCLPLWAEVDIEKLFDSFDGEPSIQAVQSHIRQSFAYQRGKIKSQHKRVRTAAWLPAFRSGFSRDVDNGQSLREKLGDANVLYNREFDTWKFDLKAEWNFSDLMFRKEELDIQKKAEGLRGEIQGILQKSTRAYFDRREQQVILKFKGDKMTDLQKLRANLAIYELTAELDVLTGGWFREQL